MSHFNFKIFSLVVLGIIVTGACEGVASTTHDYFYGTHRSLQSCNPVQRWDPVSRSCVLCLVDCDDCDISLYKLEPFDRNCYKRCPGGTTLRQTDTENLCINVGKPIVIIKDDFLKNGEAGLKNDLAILGDIRSDFLDMTFSWSLSGLTPTDYERITKGVSLTANPLVIPRENLLPGLTFDLVLQATNIIGDGQDVTKVVITSPIRNGTFFVDGYSPENRTVNGTANITTFSFKWESWDHTFPLNYKLTYYELSATGDSRRNVRVISTRTELEENKLDFMFPLTDRTINYTVALEVSNFYVSTVSTLNLIITPPADMATNLTRIISDPNITNTTDLSVMRSTCIYFKAFAPTFKDVALRRVKRGISNMYRSLKSVQDCNEDLDCSGNGQCEKTASLDVMTCDCKYGWSGRFCQWNRQNFTLIRDRITVLIENFNNSIMGADNVNDAAQVIQCASQFEDVIVREFIYVLMNKIQDIVYSPVIMMDESIASNLLEAIGNLLVETYEISAILQEEKKNLTELLLSLKNNIVSTLAVNLAAGTTFTLNTKAYDLTLTPLIKDTLTQLNVSYYNVSFENFRYDFPTKVLTAEKGIFVLESWYFNVRKDGAGLVRFLSPTLNITLLNGRNGSIPVSNLDSSEPIRLYIAKTAATPQINAGTGNTPKFHCSFVDPANVGTGLQIDGCVFAAENKTYITCHCTHLTEFVSNVDPVQGDVAPTVKIADIAKATAENFQSSNTHSLMKFLDPTDLNELTELVNNLYDHDDNSNRKLYGVWVVIVSWILFIVSYVMAHRMQSGPEDVKAKSYPRKMYSFHPIYSLIYFDHANQLTRTTRTSAYFAFLFHIMGFNSLWLNWLETSIYIDCAAACVGVAIVKMYFFMIIHFILGKGPFKGKPTRIDILVTSILRMVGWSACLIIILMSYDWETFTTWISCVFLSFAFDIILLDGLLVFFCKYVKAKAVHNFFLIRGFYAIEHEDKLPDKKAEDSESDSDSDSDSESENEDNKKDEAKEDAKEAVKRPREEDNEAENKTPDNNLLLSGGADTKKGSKRDEDEENGNKGPNDSREPSELDDEDGNKNEVLVNKSTLSKKDLSKSNRSIIDPNKSASFIQDHKDSMMPGGDKSGADAFIMSNVMTRKGPGRTKTNENTLNKTEEVRDEDVKLNIGDDKDDKEDAEQRAGLW